MTGTRRPTPDAASTRTSSKRRCSPTSTRSTASFCTAMSTSRPRPPRSVDPSRRGEAALGFFGEEAVAPLPLATFTAVCVAVQEGRAAGAVLPLENSLGGTVGEAVDALLHTELAVVAELLLPVRHQLLGVPGASLETIEQVASQQPALAQCEAFLARRAWGPHVPQGA